MKLEIYTIGGIVLATMDIFQSSGLATGFADKTGIAASFAVIDRGNVLCRGTLLADKNMVNDTGKPLDEIRLNSVHFIRGAEIVIYLKFGRTE